MVLRFLTKVCSSFFIFQSIMEPRKRKVWWPAANATHRPKKQIKPLPERLTSSLLDLLDPYLCSDVSRIVVDYDADVKERCQACRQVSHSQATDRCYRCHQIQHKTCLTATDDGLLFCRRCRDFMGDCPECQSAITTEWMDCHGCGGYWHTKCFLSSIDDPELEYCLDCWWNDSVTCHECNDEFSSFERGDAYLTCQICSEICCRTCSETDSICGDCWWQNSHSCCVCGAPVSQHDFSQGPCDGCNSVKCALCYCQIRLVDCQVCKKLVVHK